MTKKLMLLASGALTALAFAAIPAGASAEEMTADCSAATCTGTVTGTEVRLSDTTGLAVTCSTTTGTTSQSVASSSTFTVELTFDGCKDEVFGTECNNEGNGTAKIKTNLMTGHLITVEKDVPASAGVLLTGANITETCPNLGIQRTVTGNVIGTFENLTCNNASTSHTLNFTITAAGQQFDKTWTGKTFDLTSGAHASDTTTTALTTTWRITYAEGKTVKITC